MYKGRHFSPIRESWYGMEVPSWNLSPRTKHRAALQCRGASLRLNRLGSRSQSFKTIYTNCYYRFSLSTISSYMFMCGDLIISERRVHPQQSYKAPASSRKYKVSSTTHVTRLGKLFYKTSRMKVTDTYLWISPFVRYSLNV